MLLHCVAMLVLLVDMQSTTNQWLDLKAMLPLRSLVFITIGIGYQVCLSVCLCVDMFVLLCSG